MVVITSGTHLVNIQKDIEVWTVGSSKNFEIKGKTPIPWRRGASVLVPIMNGIVFVGSANPKGRTQIFKVNCNSEECTSEILPKELKQGRFGNMGFLVPDDFVTCD